MSGPNAHRRMLFDTLPLEQHRDDQRGCTLECAISALQEHMQQDQSMLGTVEL